MISNRTQPCLSVKDQQSAGNNDSRWFVTPLPVHRPRARLAWGLWSRGTWSRQSPPEPASNPFSSTVHNFVEPSN